eukprot:9673517-Prorocentrum_lima.AAC.1
MCIRDSPCAGRDIHCGGRRGQGQRPMDRWSATRCSPGIDGAPSATADQYGTGWRDARCLSTASWIRGVGLLLSPARDMG